MIGLYIDGRLIAGTWDLMAAREMAKSLSLETGSTVTVTGTSGTIWRYTGGEYQKAHSAARGAS